MADKPSRALVLYGEGLARFVGPAETHLHSFASRAICGLMALPHSPLSESEETSVIWELAELLDASEAFENSVGKTIPDDKNQEKCVFPTVAERFMGMKAAIITDNSSVKSFGVMLGFTVLDWNEFSDNNHSLPLASELLKVLGFQDNNALDASAFDLLLVHISANKMINDLNSVKFLNHLVGDLLNTAQTEANVGSRLHLSVVMSYGPSIENDHLNFTISENKSNSNSELSVLFPRQSYMVKAGKPRQNVRQHCPMLLAQYQKAVTRVDTVESFSFRDFIEKGGNLIIPADRFLHEVAFKLWKAPKYGA